MHRFVNIALDHLTDLEDHVTTWIAEEPDPREEDPAGPLTSRQRVLVLAGYARGALDAGVAAADVTVPATATELSEGVRAAWQELPSHGVGVESLADAIRVEVKARKDAESALSQAHAAAMAADARAEAWQQDCEQQGRNVAYFRGLIDSVASHLGDAVFVADDGGRHDSPLRAKVPELVKAVVAARDTLRAQLDGVSRDLTCARENQSRAAEQVAVAEKRAAKAEEDCATVMADYQDAGARLTAAESERDEARAEQQRFYETFLTERDCVVRDLRAKVAAWEKKWEPFAVYRKAHEMKARNLPAASDAVTIGYWTHDNAIEVDRFVSVLRLTLADFDSLPTAHRPGEDTPKTTGPWPECSGCGHDSGYVCEFGDASACYESGFKHHTRRLPVAPQTCGECQSWSISQWCSHKNNGKRPEHPACPAFARRESKEAAQ